MDAEKQRFVELLGVITCPNAICNFCEHFQNKSACEQHKKEVIADHLIANGVMLQAKCEACARATQEVITGLQEEIAKLRKAQEWIPVTEGLPTEWQHPGDDEHVGEPIDFIVFIRGALLPTTLWFNGKSFCDESGILYDVTHWMSLPQPPAKEENEAPSFTEKSIHCDDLVFEIETDAKGRRKVYFCGYGYLAGDESEAYPYRFVKYTFFCAPLDDAVKYGIFHLEEKGALWVKQDTEDCNYEQMMEIYRGYDNGKCPTLITEATFTADLPDGMYIIQHPTNAKQ